MKKFQDKLEAKTEAPKILLSVLPGETIDRLWGGDSSDTGPADKHTLLMLKDTEDRAQVARMVKQQLGFQPRKIGPRQIKVEQEQEVKLLVYSAAQEKKLLKLEGINYFTVDTINLAGSRKKLRDYFPGAGAELNKGMGIG